MTNEELMTRGEEILAMSDQEAARVEWKQDKLFNRIFGPFSIAWDARHSAAARAKAVVEPEPTFDFESESEE